ncbi:MAG TPA: flagellar hook-associated protein FlgL [Terriglobia bacterium]|nr:flagellar hook-associated protein FlgL [Terriglobia bacterium]
MRITSGQSYQNLLRNLESIRERMQQAQTEITSGDKINQLSDDPAGAADLVRLTGEKREIEQYTSNAASGKDRLDYTDTVLNSVQSLVQRVITLGQLGLGNPSNPASAYTTEMDGLRNQLVSTANTAFQGTFIFGGSVTNKPPYVLQPDTSVTYQGNSSATVVQVGRASTLQIQIPGSQVFSGSINVFDVVKQLSDAIKSGDKTAIQGQVTNLQQYYDSVSVVRSQVGSLSNAAQNTQSDLQAYELARASDQSRIQSADLAQATTDFTQNQTALQAAVAAGAKVSQVSILDYL